MILEMVIPSSAITTWAAYSNDADCAIIDGVVQCWGSHELEDSESGSLRRRS